MPEEHDAKCIIHTRAKLKGMAPKVRLVDEKGVQNRGRLPWSDPLARPNLVVRPAWRTDRDAFIPFGDDRKPVIQHGDDAKRVEVVIQRNDSPGVHRIATDHGSDEQKSRSAHHAATITTVGVTV